MSQKIVAAIDANGYFVGASVADESPLEPGVYLIPGGAIDIPPPDVTAGRMYRLANGAWLDEPVPEAVPVEELSEPQNMPDETSQPPTSLTMEQARLVLLHSDYLDLVEQSVLQLPREARIRWEFASTVNRSDPLTAAVAAMLSLTDADLDKLFAEGSVL